MKRIPENLLKSLQGIEGFERESFLKVHESGEQVTSVRINPAKASFVIRQSSIGKSSGFFNADDSFNQHGPAIHGSQLTIDEKVPWTKFGFYLKERPSFTFDPLFHAGCYYVQEASGMFLEQALSQLADLSQPLKVLDLCAAPGGKSTHIQSLISPDSLLVSNEIIKSRSRILIDNIIKWGCHNVMVTNNDPSAFKNLEGFFDVMVVDAPCSGSGLFRKDEEAIDEWSLNNVHLCSQRQQRILAGALPALKENGILIYSTCSYSKEEDEDIADWLVKEFEMENLELKTESNWNIVESHSPQTNSKAYRFYPDKMKGEGFFISCFRKTQGASEKKYRNNKPEKLSANEKASVRPWLKEMDLELLKENNSLFALPVSLVNNYSVIQNIVNIQYRGTGIGQIMKEKLVPEHSLALSAIISDHIPFNDLSYDQAIKYLQRQEANFSFTGKGWQLVRYQNHNLGWVNVLPNRINNYYPKELRILKQG